ncbi:family 2 glycoside hydrolase [Hyaloscypha sp. PMI_1271]|nr:family 2 glycoside hydrolase [Hyaloscypha sp. PMI_1271]
MGDASFQGKPPNPRSFPRASEPFDQALFLRPSSEYRGAPLWTRNKKLDREQLLRQIDHLAEMGMGGFTIHVRTGLDTEYLGDEFMEIVKSCVDYAESKKMLACLYDEDRWPSGYAGGKVMENRPDLKAQHILLTCKPYGEQVAWRAQGGSECTGRATRSELGHLVARYDVAINNDRMEVYRRLGDGESGRNVWHAYMEPNPPSEWFNGYTYADTLSKEATDRFIAATHEVYKVAVGDKFGSTVPSIFTDEPQFAHKTQLRFAEDTWDVFLPWTTDLPDTFSEQYGYDILDALPEIVWDLPDGSSSLARYHYHNHVCDRFIEGYLDPVSVWCRENGLAMTGHMMDEPTLFTQTSALGEAMRCYRGFDLPGVDMLCNWVEYNTVKQATSVARQNGIRGIMSEIYGVTSWMFDFLGHKFAGDWQAALGVTTRVHHLSWVTMAGEAKRDFPASIGYQSPWSLEYPLVENHFARVNVAMTRGRAVCRVAVIHPIESYWLAFGPIHSSKGEQEERDEAFLNLTTWLLHGLVDFDFISESLFESQTHKDQIGNTLPVGQSEYEVVIVPNLRTIRSTTLSRLRRFSQAGGKVIMTGTSPTLIDGIPAKKPVEIHGSIEVPWLKSKILNALEAHRDISAVATDGPLYCLTSQSTMSSTLLYQLRQDGDEQFLFICNTEKQVASKCQVSIRGSWQLTLLDTISGQYSELPSTRRNGKTSFFHLFEGCSSLLLRLTPRSETSTPKAEEALAQGMAETCLVTLRNVELSEPNVLLLDFAKFLWNDGSWEGEEEVLRIDNIMRNRLGIPLKLEAFRQPHASPPESRKAKGKLSLRFNFKSEVNLLTSHLALENAKDVHIMLDGNVIPSTVESWWVDEDISTIRLPKIPSGSHEIQLTYDYGLMTNLERIYILGDFGVEIRGTKATITASQLSKFQFGDWTQHELPFYAGNVIYNCDFEHSGGQAVLEVLRFIAPLLSVEVDGQVLGKIAFQPHSLKLGMLSEGKHKLSITSYGNRENAFGPLHMPTGTTVFIGPQAWRTEGPIWHNEYAIQPMGILQQPRIIAMKQ